MKTIQLFVFVFLSNYAVTQVTLGGNYLIDIYKPYTSEAQSYMKINENVNSQTRNAFFHLKMIQKAKFGWSLGLSYKQINHEVEDKIKTYYYYFYGNGTTSQSKYVQVNEILDLRSSSKSFGFLNEFSYSFMAKKHLKQEAGLTTEIYLLEFFKARYYYNDSTEELNHPEVELYPYHSDLRSPFLFSSANLAAFYRLSLVVDQNFSCAAKLSVGTNIYSDWDQFRKYAWVGLGVEVGFGDLKIIKHNKEEKP